MNPNCKTFLAGARALRQQLDGAISAVENFFEVDAPALSLADQTNPPFPAKVKRKWTGRVGKLSPKSKAQNPKRPMEIVRSTDVEKPTTLGGAMKEVAKQLKTFTRQQLLDALDADKDFAKLREESSAQGFAFNLKYWSTHGKLEKSGDGEDATYKIVDLNF